MAASRLDPFGDVSRETRLLARRDPALECALKIVGKPCIRRRPGGFPALFRIIVEQQVSVPSAQAIWKRCNEGVDVTDPSAVKSLGIDGLRGLGLSTPKARYVEALAMQVSAGAFDFGALPGAADDEAKARLTELKGVGPWTAAIYLLFCEGRVDIWPPGDVALQYAYAAAIGEAGKVEPKRLDAQAQTWAPLRGLAAHILWTYYAHLRGRAPI